MKRFLALSLALSLISLVVTGCDHCCLQEKESTPATSERKTLVTESQSVESSEKTPPPAAP